MLLLKKKVATPTNANLTRDVFIMWIGPKVNNIQKGKKQTHQGEVVAALRPHHVELIAANRQSFTTDIILEKSGPHSGSHVID